MGILISQSKYVLLKMQCVNEITSADNHPGMSTRRTRIKCLTGDKRANVIHSRAN